MPYTFRLLASLKLGASYKMGLRLGQFTRLIKLLSLLVAGLFALLLSESSFSSESEALVKVRVIEVEWADIFYKLPEDEQAEKLDALMPRVDALIKEYPKAAEPLIIKALILCSLAATDLSLASLGRVDQARQLLLKSVSFDDKAMDASGYVTLANLYHRVPGWPISYGDDIQARIYLERALKLYPDSIDTNFFFGDFLLDEGEYDKALPYLEKADQAPIRPHALLSDLKLKEQLKEALEDARERNDNRDSFFARFLSL